MTLYCDDELDDSGACPAHDLDLVGGYTMTTFAEDLRERFGGGSEADETMRDLADHGADAGFPGITYYTDTVAMYEAHKDEIWEALAQDADEMGLPHPLALVAAFRGADNVQSGEQLSHLLCWYMAERVAHDEDRSQN